MRPDLGRISYLLTLREVLLGGDGVGLLLELGDGAVEPALLARLGLGHLPKKERRGG
jgi:hypothetical protein